MDFSQLFAKADDLVNRAKAEQQQKREAEVAAMIPLSPQVTPAVVLDWPPGTVGELAKVFYQCSIRPVREIAIASALAVYAGICGREWVIPKSGLNLYIILLARSAIGKEAISDACAMVHRIISEGNLLSQPFFDFSECASGQALRQLLGKSPCFVQVSSEWGENFAAMANKRDAPKQTLRKQVKNLYHKSSPTSIVGGLTYADPTKNLEDSRGSVAFSFIGECTPSAFMSALTEDMMSDGTMSRLLVIEYEGDRPDENPSPLADLPSACKEHLRALATHAMSMRQRGYVPINIHGDAYQLTRDFNTECDQQIRGKFDEGWRQMWNRAHLKVLRIAGLLAAADQYLNPWITTAHVQWAISLVRRDIATFRRRQEDGDVGVSDDSRERKLTRCITDYLTNGAKESYRIPPAMKKDGIVPRKYLQVRCSTLPAFRDHNLGANAALDLAIRSLVDSGYMKEVPAPELTKNYTFSGKAYRVISLRDDSAK